MRVLFTSWGWPSHFYPLVPLAWACGTAGHEVRVASQPALTESVMKAGLPAYPVGHDVDFNEIFERLMAPLLRAEAGTQDIQSHKEALRTVPFHMFCEVAWSMADELLTMARQWQPDLVIYESTSYAALLVASELDIPAVRHTWSADYTYYGSDGEQEVLPGALFDKYGIPPIDATGSLTVDACPTSMQIDTHYVRQPVRYVPYNGGGTTPQWLLHDPPAEKQRVCLTWGTSTSRVGQDLFALPEAIAALSEVPDIELVAMITPAQRQLLGSVPASVHVVEGVPLSCVLPTCSAQVQQGGPGTIMTALQCGVPQLTVPDLPDQNFNARQLAATGAGTVLPRADATPDALRAATNELLVNPAYSQAARTMAREIAEAPSPADIVTVLESLAGNTKPFRYVQ